MLTALASLAASCAFVGACWGTLLLAWSLAPGLILPTSALRWAAAGWLDRGRLPNPGPGKAWYVATPVRNVTRDEHRRGIEPWGAVATTRGMPYRARIGPFPPGSPPRRPNPSGRTHGRGVTSLECR